MIELPVKHRHEAVAALASSDKWDVLLEFDQLRNQLRISQPKADLSEAEINFAPSYGCVATCLRTLANTCQVHSVGAVPGRCSTAGGRLG